MCAVSQAAIPSSFCRTTRVCDGLRRSPEAATAGTPHSRTATSQRFRIFKLIIASVNLKDNLGLRRVGRASGEGSGCCGTSDLAPELETASKSHTVRHGYG